MCWETDPPSAVITSIDDALIVTIEFSEMVMFTEIEAVSTANILSKIESPSNPSASYNYFL